MKTNQAYLKRKAQKQSLYAQQRMACVEWVPASNLTFVCLPTRR